MGESRLRNDRMAATADVRTVNNRHFKLSARISEPYGVLEPEIERLARESVRRGTVQLNLRVERPRRAEDYRLNLVALSSYREQLRTWLGANAEPDLAALLALPGVVEDVRSAVREEDPHEDWPALSGLIREALAGLQESRAVEGRAMAAELQALGQGAARHLDAIAARGPEVVAAYQKRLQERVQALTESQGVAVEPEALIREVAIFAERGDIAEEVTRLRAHIAQYLELIAAAPEGAGRRLEFIVQEMGRETNTIGSKANDVAISRGVVEIKSLLEKVRELIQNVE